MLPIPAEELNGSGTLGPYWTFYRAVVAEQLSQMAAPQAVRRPRPVRRPGRWSRQAARAGHRVIEVLDFRRAAEGRAGCTTPPGPPRTRRRLAFLPDESVDAVVAEERAMSSS